MQAPGNSQSYNRYSYCINNPLIYTDPTGYNWWQEFWGKIFGGKNNKANRDAAMSYYNYTLDVGYAVTSIPCMLAGGVPAAMHGIGMFIDQGTRNNNWNFWYLVPAATMGVGGGLNWAIDEGYINFKGGDGLGLFEFLGFNYRTNGALPDQMWTESGTLFGFLNNNGPRLHRSPASLASA